MKIGTPSHIKTTRLKRRLNIPLYQAVGLLEMLWAFTAQCADDGCVGRYTDEDIAIFLEWEGDPGELISALIEAGYLNDSEVNRLVVHDWLDHAPKFIKDRLRQRGNRLAGANGDSVKGSDCSTATLPAATKSDTTQQNATRDTMSHPVAINHANSSQSKPSQSKSAADVAAVVEAWNKLSGVRLTRGPISDKRRRVIRSRLGESFWPWREALEKFPLPCFSSGDWVPTIDWFLRPDTVAKIVEDSYDWQPDGKSGKAYKPPPPPSGEQVKGREIQAQLKSLMRKGQGLSPEAEELRQQLDRLGA